MNAAIVPLNDDDALRFLPLTQIVAIDNKRNELQKIAAALNSIGLPCTTMFFDAMNGLEMPDRWEVDSARIVFLDLNLREIEVSPSAIELSLYVAEALDQLRPANPYLLVFWTKHPKEVEAVMRRLVQNHGSVIRFPLAYLTIDKGPFLATMDGSSDLKAVKEKVHAALRNNEVFLALLAWESRIVRGAGKALDSLHRLVGLVQPDGRAQDDTEMVDLLRGVAVAAWGRNQAKGNPGGAVTSGLVAILLDHLDSLTVEEQFQKVWKRATKGGWTRKLPARISPASLNTHCLVDVNARSRDSRGAWLEFTTLALRRQRPWKTHFGCGPDQLKEEFINAGIGKAGSAIKRAVSLGLLECTAPCDFAQSKAPLQRFILGARIPTDSIAHVMWENPERRRKHEAVQRIEAIVHDGREFVLYVDFKYSLSLHKDHELLTTDLVTPLFRVRRQVLADIAARLAAHTTRPGLFCFATKDEALGPKQAHQ